MYLLLSRVFLWSLSDVVYVFFFLLFIMQRCTHNIVEHPYSTIIVYSILFYFILIIYVTSFCMSLIHTSKSTMYTAHIGFNNRFKIKILNLCLCPTWQPLLSNRRLAFRFQNTALTVWFPQSAGGNEYYWGCFVVSKTWGKLQRWDIVASTCHLHAMRLFCSATSAADSNQHSSTAREFS